MWSALWLGQAARTAPAAAVAVTERAVRSTTRGRGRPKVLPLLRDIDLLSEEASEFDLLPPAAKKKTRTLYTTGKGCCCCCCCW